MGVKGLRERRKFPGPSTERSKAKTEQSRITLYSKLKIVPDHKDNSCHGGLALNRYGYGEDEQAFRKRKAFQERLNFSCSLKNNGQPAILNWRLCVLIIIARGCQSIYKSKQMRYFTDQKPHCQKYLPRSTFLTVKEKLSANLLRCHISHSASTWTDSAESQLRLERLATCYSRDLVSTL